MKFFTLFFFEDFPQRKRFFTNIRNCKDSTDSASAVFGIRRPTLGLFVIYRVLVSHQANEQLILGPIVNIHSIRITHFIGSMLLLYNVNNIQIKNIYFNES